MPDAISAALPWKVARPFLLPPIPLYSPLYRILVDAMTRGLIELIELQTPLTFQKLNLTWKRLLLSILDTFNIFFSTNLYTSQKDIEKSMEILSSNHSQ